jgi:hypothetical protein
MTWSRAETPQDAFGRREKRYNLSGCLQNYKDHLNENELADITMLLGYLCIVSTVNDHSSVHVMLVGSAAAGAHVDIDLLGGLSLRPEVGSESGAGGGLRDHRGIPSQHLH